MTYFQEGRNFHTFQEDSPSPRFTGQSVKRIKRFKNVAPENNAPVLEYSTFYEEFKILFWIARLYGVFPYHIDESGDLSIRLFSLQILYSVALVTCIAVLSIYATIDWVHQMKQGMNFRESVNIYALWLFIESFILIPLNHWPEVWKKVAFVNNWKKFQKFFIEITGKAPQLDMRRKLTIVVIGYVILEVLLLVQIEIMELCLNWWHMLVYIHVGGILFLMPIVWIFTCISFSKMAELLFEEIRKHVCSSVPATSHQLKQYRILWLKLSELTEELGSSAGLTFGGMTVLLFSSSILYAYCFLVRIYEHFNYALMCVIICINGIIFVQCDAALTAMNKVGSTFSKSLEALTDNLPANEVANMQEMRIFLSAISRNSPTITFASFVIVNRGFMVSLLSTMVTDLIVLVQFQISNEQDTKNNGTE